MRSLWLDEGGGVLSFELVLTLVSLLIGISVGIVFSEMPLFRSFSAWPL